MDCFTVIKNTIILFLVSLIYASITFAASDPPPVTNGVWVAITRVSTSIAYTNTNSVISIELNEGFDYGDTDSVITNEYGGLLFIVGSPLEVEMYISKPLTNRTWKTVVLQYATTPTPLSNQWMTLQTIQKGITNMIDKRTVPFKNVSLPTGEYLLRVYAVLSNNAYTSDITSDFVMKRGDDATWFNREVVSVSVGQKAPGHQ